MSTTREFLKISVEGIVGGGCNEFMWQALEYGEGEVVWSGLDDRSVFDGDWTLSTWTKELRERYASWEGAGVVDYDVEYVFYERSIWSFMVYTLWNFRLCLPTSLQIDEYQTLKLIFKALTEDMDKPDAIIYFECASKKSPLPKEQFWCLDEMYETWLCHMETEGVPVLRIPPIMMSGLEKDYLYEKLIDTVVNEANLKHL